MNSNNNSTNSNSTNNNSVNSLFGGNWNNIASQVPIKVPSMDGLFRNIKTGNIQIAVAYDGSGSTVFGGSKSVNNEGFDEIYAEALKQLQNELPSDHEVICWSSEAIVMKDKELETFKNAINNRIPFATIITKMNGGTEPQTIIPLAIGKTVVIITDGEIGDNAVNTIQRQISTSGVGAVFLVIVPHIDSYKNLYNNAQVESSAKDSIRLSIPQAFSGKLATVAVWNYKKKTFDLVSELTAPWAKHNKSLGEALNNALPIIPSGEFLIKNDKDQYQSFSLDELVEWLSKNPVDETTVQKLADLEVGNAVRQQASPTQRDKWNICIQQIYGKILEVKVKNEYVDEKVPENANIMEMIKITRNNDVSRKKVENKYKDAIGKVCEKLLVDKTVGEITNIAQAKVTQTKNNVFQFQSMKSSDKLDELASALVFGKCAICNQENTNIFKTIIFPGKLIPFLSTCKTEKVVNGKKNKKTTLNLVDIEALETVLTTHRPRFHFLDLCAECAKVSVEQCKQKHNTSIEYDVTGLIPQNTDEKLVLFPFVDPSKIHNTTNPNEQQLSYARQWLRGFISKYIGLDPASQDCMKACLCFLTKLANNKENAEVVFGTQVSLMRGGAQDKYRDLAGRLFYPNTRSLSSEALTIISLVEEVIEKTERPILPEVNKLLLLCLLARQVTPLIIAKNNREKATAKLYETLERLIKGENSLMLEKFGIVDEHVKIIKTFTTARDFKSAHDELFTRFLATYLQNTMNMNIQQIVTKENYIGKVLNASNMGDAAEGLNLNVEYLNKMVARSKLADSEFLTLAPKFIAELVSNNFTENKMDLYQKFL